MPLGDPAAIEIARLRVATYQDDGPLAVAPAVRWAVTEAAAALGARAAAVEPFSPPEVGHARDLFHGILGADGFAGSRRVLGPTAGIRASPGSRWPFAASRSWICCSG